MTDCSPTGRTCYHCHEPVPAGVDLQVTLDGQLRDMCCTGCAAVAGMLSDCNLEGFYQLRTAAAARPALRSEQWWQAFDEPQLLDQLAETDDRRIYRMPVNVSNLRCAACVWLLETCLRKLPGVEHIVINFATGQGELHWRPVETALSDILIEADKLGYPLQPALLANHGEQRARQRTSLRRLLVSALGMFQVMMMSLGLYLGAGSDMLLAERDFFRWIALLLATPVVWYSGWPFLQSAWRQLRCLKPGMDVPVSLAILLAWSSSCISTFTGSGEVYFDSAVMFVFFLTVSRHLEQHARLRATAVSQRASQLLPLMVKRLLNDDQHEIIQPLQLRRGDKIEAAAGETLAADGVLLGNSSVTVNESLLTGESQPVTKHPGATLLAGSQVLDGAVCLLVTACGKHTTLAAIQQLMRSAGDASGNVFDWSGRVAVWFTCTLLLLAGFTAFLHWPAGWQQSLHTTLAVLVVSCPCALALAIPSALSAARARLARNGVLVRDTSTLMRLPGVTRLVVDKTGTLTHGKFRLNQIRSCTGLDDQQLVELAAALARHSHHPLAQALQDYPPSIVAEQIDEVPGQGISAVLNEMRYRLGKLDFVAALCRADTAQIRAQLSCSDDRNAQSELWLSNQHQVLGLMLLSDELKHNAAEILKASALPVTLLSGDTPAAVSRAAGQLGINDFHGAMLPEHKLARLQALQHTGEQVMAVGDGINDAPLLAAADVGIAIGVQHSLAKAAADVLILHDDLSALPALHKLAMLTRRRIRQNLSWALLYNLSIIPVAMLGWLPPWLAALGMSLSSLLVVGNSLRLNTPGIGNANLEKSLQTGSDPAYSAGIKPVGVS